MLIMIMPLLYGVTVFCLILIYCKYKKVKFEYEILQEQKENSRDTVEIKNQGMILFDLRESN